jgi:hypothetical protein
MPQEMKAKLLEGRPRVDEQRQDDAQQSHQHQQGKRLRDAVKEKVLHALLLGNGNHVVTDNLTCFLLR